jgi:hypothetical protein
MDGSIWRFSARIRRNLHADGDPKPVLPIQKIETCQIFQKNLSKPVIQRNPPSNIEKRLFYNPSSKASNATVVSSESSISISKIPCLRYIDNVFSTFNFARNDESSSYLSAVVAESTTHQWREAGCRRNEFSLYTDIRLSQQSDPRGRVLAHCRFRRGRVRWTSSCEFSVESTTSVQRWLP